MEKEVILTGLRSNGEFHLGNYLGAILPVVQLQKKYAGKYQLNMFIPDLHSITTLVDYGKLAHQSIENLKVFIAAGLDVNQPDTYIYRQSYVPAHSELTWILGCFTGYGVLERMTQFKDKYQTIAQDNSKKYNEVFAGKSFDTTEMKRLQEPILEEAKHSITAGLYLYPLLMAADILLYGARWIPVGDDQRQHIEFTRDLAIRVNNKFGDLFVVPEDNKKQVEFAGRTEPVRIRSLRNPDKKMSKSIEDPAGTILLSDKPDDAAQKIMSATTDSLGSIKYDFENQPGVSNLLQILALLTSRPQEEINKQWEGKDNYGELKQAVAGGVSSFLSELQSKIERVDESQLNEKLASDEAAMGKVAGDTLLKVQQAVGLR